MSPNQQQLEAWNGPESAHYVDNADRYDRQFAMVADALIQRAAIEPQHAVLDVGCGSGATTLGAARAAKTVVGVDISQPLLEVAADRARLALLDNVEFLVADAQTHDFAEGTFDIALSQFGLMFFDEPVSAFSNLRRALAPEGRVVFTTWQDLTANEWLTLIARAVAPYAEVPDLGGITNGPGMFALKDPSETTALLEAAGFRDILVEPISPTVLLGGGGTLDESADFLFGLGIVRGLMGGLDAEGRESVTAAVRAELEGFHEPSVGVRLGAGVWLISASS